MFLCVCGRVFLWFRRPALSPAAQWQSQRWCPKRSLQIIHMARFLWKSLIRITLTDIRFSSMLSNGTESYDVFIIDRCRHHMQFARSIYITQQFLIQFIWTDQTKADESQLHKQTNDDAFLEFFISLVFMIYAHLDLIANFETFIFAHQLLKLFGQMYVLSNVCLQSRYAIIPYNKPVGSFYFYCRLKCWFYVRISLP